MRPERSAALLATIAGLAAAWVAFDLLVWAYGESPQHLFVLLFQGTWGSAYGAGQVLYKATPLLFTGLAVDLALRAGLFNIGAEGQMAIGGLAAGAVGAWIAPWLPAPIAVLTVVLAGTAAGALWAFVPAILRARFRAHEVISTIMMNRIADAMIGLLLGMGLAMKGTVRTEDIVPAAHVMRLERLIPALQGSAVNLALFVAVTLTFAVTWAYGGTRLGREITLIGQNPIACAAEKIPVARRIAECMVVSGALCGLACSTTVLGYKGYFEQGLGAGAGFGGLAVALLGRGSGVGLVLAALLFGTLQQGGLAINAHVPMELMDVIQGVVIAAVALADGRIRTALAKRVGLAAA